MKGCIQRVRGKQPKQGPLNVDTGQNLSKSVVFIEIQRNAYDNKNLCWTARVI